VCWVCWRLYLLVSFQLFAARLCVLGALVFGRGSVVEIPMDPFLVVPVDPHQRGKLYLLNRLVETVEGAWQRIVLAVTGRTDRRDGIRSR
jgi:hypothetical protein